MTVVLLKQALAAKSLPTGGRKQELVARLEAASAAAGPSGSKEETQVGYMYSGKECSPALPCLHVCWVVHGVGVGGGGGSGSTIYQSGCKCVMQHSRDKKGADVGDMECEHVTMPHSYSLALFVETNQLS